MCGNDRETTCVLGLEPMCVCAPLSVRVLSTLFVCGALWAALSLAKGLYALDAFPKGDEPSSAPTHSPTPRVTCDRRSRTLSSPRRGRDSAYRPERAGTLCFRQFGPGLSRGHRVNSGLETLDQAELFVHHLGQRRQTVGRAWGVRHHCVGSSVLVMVHSHHVHGHGILGRRGDDHLLRSSAQVQLGLVLLREDGSRLADVVGASGSPADGSWILLVEDLDAVAIDNEETVANHFRHRDGTVESPVDTVALELVDQVIERHEGVVDGDHFHIQWHGTWAFQYDRSSQCPTVSAWLLETADTCIASVNMSTSSRKARRTHSTM